jgi:uroporphyrinogen-III decarboxylase
MPRAKKILGDRVCIMGNVPMSLLSTGTPDQVKEYCKKLLDSVGTDGGFIMSSAAVLDDAKVENVRAMVDFTREYR